MSSLRQRVPFQTAGDDEDDRGVVLDDVEQDELVSDLRERSVQTTARAILVLDAVLALSALLQIVYLLSPSKASPLLALVPASAPASAAPDADPPLPTAFALLALALHANLALHLHRAHFSSSPALTPLSYPLCYALAAVAPTLALFLARAWQATVWAAVPALVVGLVHSVHSTLQEGDEALAELESLKYRAPGP
ncbi:hypothetical protein B0H17DRAFT_1084002 [Mycena rosella]|uniref:Uncharacterized protein n=1 Tax=Mycena rosella TaxID=1033263 RepID=A0AAD7D0D0_MYCRO|nr:hypothetical protein B0H17DRAFT_1084002 [Mycena rosella]